MGCIIKRPWISEGKLHCQYPIGSPEKRMKAVKKIVALYSSQCQEFEFFAVSDENLAELNKLYGSRVSNIENPQESWEYILDAHEQITLEGSQFSDRRNKLRRFNKLNNWTYEEITQANMEDCFAIASDWYERHDKMEGVENDFCELKIVVSHYDQLNCQGGLLSVDGKAVAFCIGTPFNTKINMCLFMKALNGYRDASIVLLNEFWKRNCAEYSYINYSSDAGLPGLRKFKTMLHPKFLVPSYSVTIKPFD